MTAEADFASRLEAKITEQLRSQRVGYLLGAGSSYLDGDGYPLSFELWELIRNRIADEDARAKIQAKLEGGASGIEHALDLLDDGGAIDTPYRHLVVDAIADLFMGKNPSLDFHGEFLRRLSARARPEVYVFSLNYDPLIERAAESVRVRVSDGFLGVEHAFFDAAVFDEHIGIIRGSFKWRQLNETVFPIRVLKLHGSLGWYECHDRGVRRCAFGSEVPDGTKRLMVPPQRRKGTDTMHPPYSALWSRFRACLAQNAKPLNRLACFGYGFADEHVNDVIEAALARRDFTLLVFTRDLGDEAWSRWSCRANVVAVTESRCSLKGEIGPGHPDLWRFERLCREV